MSGQTKKHSVAEAVINVLVGMVTSLLVQVVIFPLFNIRMSAADNINLCLIFTVVSVIRSYLLRRFFNWLMLNERRP